MIGILHEPSLMTSVADAVYKLGGGGAAMRTDRGSVVIEHGTIVVPGGVLEGASVRIEDGVITEISPDGIGGNGRRVDAAKCYVLPGFIDLHSDAIEKEIEPRPNALFPVTYALFESTRS